ncbi:MAG: hypothetical protein ACXWVT_09505 [Burkholderiaceae bacterium]
MSKRSWMVMALAVGVVALSGCVVVPEQPGYGYGQGYGYGGPPRGVYVAPPPVVVVPPPRPRFGYGPHRHYEGRRWR